MLDRKGIDVPPVSEADAIALCLHHLQLAAAYFEATPDNTTELITLVEQECNVETPSGKAIFGFVVNISEAYEAEAALETGDDDE